MAAVVAITLAGALCIALGWVLQQHVAAQEPPAFRLSFRLLGHLARRPLWLAGIAAMASGQILGAVALGQGDLALIEPLMATNLLFALPLSALWHRRHLGLREWTGAISLIAGLAAFIAASDPRGGSTAHVGPAHWALSGGTIAVVAGTLVLLSRGRRAALQATLLASAAGVLYGLQDALTQRAMDRLHHGAVALFTSWPTFAVVVVAVIGMLLAQSAFEAAPLAASLPPMTVAEPITGIAFGVGVYGEVINLSGGLLAVQVLSFAVMVVGVYMVAGSPLVTNQGPGGPAPRQLEKVD